MQQAEEEQLTYNQKWTLSNPDYHRIYRENNKERIKEYQNKYRAENYEKIRKYNKEYHRAWLQRKKAEKMQAKIDKLKASL